MPVFLCLAAPRGELAAHASRLEAFMREYGVTDFDWTPTTLCGLVQLGNALNCALKLHSFVLESGPRPSIALHAGPCERLGRLILGAGLSHGRHLAKAAWGGQILVTPEYLAAVRLPPEAETKALGRHMLTDLNAPTPLFQLCHPELEVENYRPLRSLSYYPHNLRVQPTDFVGRTRELEDLQSLVRAPDIRLVTLTGPGGIGKTRLALQAAAEAIHAFPQGVFAISCETLPSAALLPSTIEQALSLTPSGRIDPRTHLLNQLRRRALLLVLDNYESLLPDTTLVREILERAPHVKLLLTSREPVNLPEERLYPLGGLRFPRKSSPEEVAHFETFDAAQLFFLAALRTDKFFAIPESTRDAVVTICELVEGLPLGLELAATSVSVFSCQEIAQRITQGLGVLETTRRELPARHQSLRATFEFTRKSLTAAEQSTFARCAVFHGVFNAIAAEQIVEATPETLETLARKSMLVNMQAGQYKMHPLLRHFAAEQLALIPEMVDALEARHSLYFLTYLRDHSAALWDERQIAAAETLAHHLDDIRAAWLRTCRSGDLGLLKDALPGLLWFYTIREMPGEGAVLFAESAASLRARITQSPLPDPMCELVLADCSCAEGMLAIAMTQNARAQDRFDEALEMFLKHENQKGKVQVQTGLGQVAFNRGQYHLAKSCFQQAYEGAKAIQSAIDERGALHHLGHVYMALGDQEAAGACLDRSLALSEALNEWWLGMHTLRLRGNVEKNLGHNKIARDFYQRSLEMARTRGSLLAMSLAVNNLGVLATIASEYRLARRYYEQALAIQREIDNSRALANALHNLGVTVSDLGEPELGLQLLDEAWTIHENDANEDGKGYTLLYRAYALEVLGDHATVEATYGKALALFEVSGSLGAASDARECLGFYLHSQGRWKEAEPLFLEALKTRQILTGPGGIATAYRGLGDVATASGRYEEARVYFREALRLALDAQWIGTLLHTFVEVAELYAQMADTEGALQILMAVLQDGRIVVPMQQRIRARIAALLPTLPAEAAEAFQHFNESLDIEGVARTLINSLEAVPDPLGNDQGDRKGGV